MSVNNKELELYKMVNEKFECGWINESEFAVWVEHSEIQSFIDGICKVFGTCMFEDGGLEVRMQREYICISLSDMLDGSDIDFEYIFPRDEFKH